MQLKKQQSEPDMEHQTGSKLRKEYSKAVYCNWYTEYIMWNAGLDEAQGEIKTAWRNNSN